MTDLSLTDLSFCVRYDSNLEEWCATVRELPMKLEVKSYSPIEALTALTHHVNELLSYLDPKQYPFSTITDSDWDDAMKRAKVTANDVRTAIREKSLTLLMDKDGIDIAAAKSWNVWLREDMSEKGKVGDTLQPFTAGFKRGVSVALKADL